MQRFRCWLGSHQFPPIARNSPQGLFSFISGYQENKLSFISFQQSAFSCRPSGHFRSVLLKWSFIAQSVHFKPKAAFFVENLSTRSILYVHILYKSIHMYEYICTLGWSDFSMESSNRQGYPGRVKITCFHKKSFLISSKLMAGRPL